VIGCEILRKVDSAMLRQIHHQLVHFGQRIIRLLKTWTKPTTHNLIGSAVIDLTRSKRDLIWENALLRQQLIVIERQIKRPTLTWRDRVVFVVLASRLRTWKASMLIVRPETVLRWHRDLFPRL